MSTITPESISGFNAVGRTTGMMDDLRGLSFPTACPPDVGPRTRIVAICGITDENNFADPAKHGWFLSDFYLFHYLFSRVHGPTPSQIWMTSENPEDLVLKYKEYAHGPRGERRIVLDEDMLPVIQQSGTLRVVPRRDLLERFQSTLKEQSRLAKENNEHLLILIFGHGDEATFGVYIGSGNSNKPPRLRMENVKPLLQRDAPITLFMTSCFSGGWLTQPITNTAQHINATGMTAAGPKSQSLSWPLSASLGRACGGRVATGLLRSAFSVEDSKEMNELNEFREDPTYIEFANSIHQTYNSLDSFAQERQIHFSAQDDKWGDHFIRRTGLPLSQLKVRWESLRLIPSGDYSGSQDQGSSRTGSMGFGTLRKRSKLAFAAQEYLSANPGEDSLAGNVALHSALYRFTSGKERFSDKEIDEILEAVKYRIDALQQANELAGVMEITNPSFDSFSYNVYWPLSPEEDKTHYFAWRLLVTNPLIDKPRPNTCYGFPSSSWTKPYSFLATCFAKAGLTSSEIHKRIDMALSYKHKEAQVISLLHGTRVSNPETVRHRDLMLRKFRTLKTKAMEAFRGQFRGMEEE